MGRVNIYNQNKTIRYIIVMLFIVISLCLNIISVDAKCGTEEKISLLNFESFTELIGTGGVPSKLHTRQGQTYSLRWYNHSNKARIKLDDIPQDWSNYTHLEIWMYSAKATGGEFMIIPECGADENGSIRYFQTLMNFDWTGWKRIEINLSDLKETRRPKMNSVEDLLITCYGWGMTATDADVYIAEINLLNEGVSGYSLEKIEATRTALNGGYAVYAGSADVTTSNGYAGTMGKTAYCLDNKIYVPEEYFNVYLEKDVSELDCEEIDGTKYYQLITTAKKLGLYAVAERNFAAASTNESLMELERIRGVNELTEIAQYWTADAWQNTNDFTESDCIAVKEKWKESLVGSDLKNDMSVSGINKTITAIQTKGYAYRSYMVKDSQTELFTTITIDTPAVISKAYSYLFQIAQAYNTHGSSMYKNASAKEDILYGLEWMYNNYYGENAKTASDWRKFGSPNWWEWYIGAPTYLIKTLMIMDDDLSSELIKKYMSLYDTYVPTTYDMCANMLDTAYISLGSAVLQNDIQRIKRILVKIEESYSFVDGKKINTNSAWTLTTPKSQGFYTDGSYLFHNVYAMNGAYGITNLSGISNIAALLKDTSFEIKNPQINNISEWIYNSFEPVLFEGNVMRMMMGRNASQHSSGYHLISTMLDCMETLDDGDRMLVGAIIKAQVLADDGFDYFSNLTINQAKVLNDIINDSSIVPRFSYKTSKVFYNVDKAVHQRDDFAFGVSMHSSRIGDYECINGQNLSGWYLSDGMTEYYIKGQVMDNEYWNYVNPYKLPGITADSQERQAVSIAQGRDFVTSKDFVGGAVLNSEYTTAAMWLESYHRDEVAEGDFGFYGGSAPRHDNDLEAKKAYFMFDNEVVCLGNEINSTQNSEVLTVVDNKIANKTATDNEKVIGTDKIVIDGTEQAGAEIYKSDPEWASLEDVGGYYFPNGGEFYINRTSGEKSFYELWFSHGENPVNGEYAYTLLPGMTSTETAQYSENPDICILANTSNVQAVSEKNTGVVGAVFWEPASIAGVSVAQPMIVTMQRKSGLLTVSVADPTQKLNTGKLTISSYNLHLKSCDNRMSINKNTDGETVIDIDFSRSTGDSVQAEFYIYADATEEYAVLAEFHSESSIADAKGGSSANISSSYEITYDDAPMSLKWEAQGKAEKTTPINTYGVDWSQYKNLRIRLHTSCAGDYSQFANNVNSNKSGDRFVVLLYPEGVTSPYKYTVCTAPDAGWQELIVPLSNFAGAAELKNITRFAIYNHGWGVEPADSEHVICIDKIWLEDGKFEVKDNCIAEDSITVFNTNNTDEIYTMATTPMWTPETINSRSGGNELYAKCRIWKDKNYSKVWTASNVDSSEYKYLNLWVYSPAINNAQYNVILGTENSTYAAVNKGVGLDYVGWKLVTIDFSKYNLTNPVTKVIINVGGWSAQTAAWTEQGSFGIEKIWFSKELPSVNSYLNLTKPTVEVNNEIITVSSKNEYENVVYTEPVSVIVGEYDETGCFKKASINNQYFNNQDLEVNITNEFGNGQKKLFIFNSTSGLLPLCDSIEFK